MDRRRYMQALGLGGAVSLAGCLDGAGETAALGGRLTLATGSTAYDSGLLDSLHPQFEDAFGASVDAVPRGTGAALQTARNGDCDVVLVHARPLEDEFLAAGYGLNRRSLMLNDFRLVGPPEDPANVAGETVLEALRTIARAEASFLSRGDRSGTHIRERRLWEAAGVDPAGEWYLETGQGMGDTLTTAAQTGAYTLSDRGTFLAVSDGDSLAAHVSGGLEDPAPLLRNEYAVIAVNPARHDVAYPLALAYIGFLTGPAQAAIEAFRVAGQPAFRPTALSETPQFEQYVPSDYGR
jgi:tungstate transport system substrate-binding protein